MQKVILNETVRPLFRIIVPRFARHNVFSGPAKKTLSLSAVMVATCANKSLPWLDVEVIDENNYRQSRRAPRDKNGEPDHTALQRERPATFIGISCSMTNAMPRALELVRWYRTQPGIQSIIAGGWHVIYEPREILEAGATVVVHGEGEMVISELLTRLYYEQSIFDVPGISYRHEGEIKRNPPHQLLVEDLDLLPHPDFGLVRFAKIKIYPVSRIRGCSGRCEFCSVKGRPRAISPMRFLDQLKLLISRGAKRFFLVDDRTEEDREGSLAFFKGLADFCQNSSVRISMTVQVRLSLAKDHELLSAMRNAGVEEVCIGYESPIKEELRAMKKPIDPAKMLEWTRIFKELGFFIHAMFIFGYPLLPHQRDQFRMSARERAKHFWQFIKKLSRSGADTIQILLLTPLLGTEVRARLEKEGRIYNFGWEYYDGTWLLFKADPGIDPEELQIEMTRLMRRFYAFNYLWRFKIIALFLHLIKIGCITIALPLQYFFSGFQFRPWYNHWRNSIIHCAGHLIILRWLKSFKKINFLSHLRQRDIIQ